MAAVSKHLREFDFTRGTGLAVSRCVYTAAIVGYICKVAYPYWKKKKTKKEEHKMEEEEEIDEKATSLVSSKIARAKADQESSPSVNREFFRRIRLLLGIMIPSVWSREMGILLLHTATLFARWFPDV